MSLAHLPSSGVSVELWKPKFSTVELGKQVTLTDFAKDHDTSLTLAQAHAAEGCRRSHRGELGRNQGPTRDAVSPDKCLDLGYLSMYIL